MKFVASSCSQTSPQPNASSSSIPHSSSRHGVGTIPILFTIFLIIFSFCITDVNSMIVEKDKFSISSDHRFTTLFSFVFEKDGTLDFHMNITKPSEEDFVVLFCDESELEKLRDPDMTFERVCAKPKPGLCKHETIIPKKSEKEVWKLDNYVMPKQSRYRVLQLNCKQRPYSGTLSYTAVNPGGEYLSLIYIPYKTLFYFISAMWGGLLLLWCFNLFQYAAWNTKAQRLLIFVPFFKAVTSIIMIGYWRQSSKTGHAPKHFYWLGLASLLSARGILFFSVLMLAIGFGLTRSSIPSAYSKRMAIMVGFYVLALGMHHLNLEMAFLLMVIDYAFIWQLLAMFISYTQNELDLQASLLQQMTVRVSSTPLYPKIKALKELQSAMVVFVLADLFLLFWSSVFAVNMPWMDELLENLNMFILLVRVYRVYRLRPFNPHLNSLAKAHTQTLTAQEATLVIDELQTRIVSLDRPTSTDGSITLDSTLWKPGKSYPRPLPLDLEMIVKPAAPRESCVTMIHNPCTCAYQQQQTQNAQVGSVGSVNAGVDGGSGSGSIYSSTSYSQSQSPGSRQQQNLMYNEHTCVHTDIGVLFAKLERPKAPVVSSDIHGYNRIGSGSISGNRDNNSQDDHGFTVISPLASERDPGSLHYDADESGYEMSSTSPKLAKKSKKTPSSASTSSMNGIEADAKDATSPTTMTDSLSPSNKSPNSRSSTRADRENARNNSSLGNILSRATSSKSSTKYERLANEDDN